MLLITDLTKSYSSSQITHIQLLLQTGVNEPLREAAGGLLQALAERSTLSGALQVLASNALVSHAVLEPLQVAFSRARRAEASQVPDKVAHLSAKLDRAHFVCVCVCV